MSPSGLPGVCGLVGSSDLDHQTVTAFLTDQHDPGRLISPGSSLSAGLLATHEKHKNASTI